MNAGPLSDIRVLDLTRLIPGPFATLVLVDLGADVVKVEDPEVGDYERATKPLFQGLGYRFRMLNRGKRSIALDLKAPEGREVFLRLVEKADVVVEGFRPGVMERLGVGYEQLRRVNPAVVVCSISSYGASGPNRDRVAHDLNILAETGLLDVTGAPDGPPAIPGIQIADTVSSLYAVIGILSALQQRARTGAGTHVDLSMQDCALSLMFDALRYPLAEGRVPERGRERLTGGLANYRVYRTRDERYLAVGSLEKKFKDELFRRMGLGAWIDPEGGVTATEVDREKESALQQRLEAVFASKTLPEWMELLGPANLCASPVRTVAEVPDDEHLRARGMVLEATVEGERFTTLGPAVRLERTRPPAAVGGAPLHGQHTSQVLEENGFSRAEIEGLLRRGSVGGAAHRVPKRGA